MTPAQSFVHFIVYMPFLDKNNTVASCFSESFVLTFIVYMPFLDKNNTVASCFSESFVLTWENYSKK